MPQKQRRYTLKAKEAKQALTQASEKLKLNLEGIFGAKANVEIVEADAGDILLINGKPTLFKAGNAVLPTLNAAEILACLPKAVVDMGAIPHVCNGADIMAPGIVRYEGEFGKGDIILVVDVKHGKPLAIGETLLASEEAKNTRQGVAIRNLHYVGDKIWNLTKAITP
ncbi:MAG: DUF1947 domain-containing protein [Candidatus Bathyarchaeia archaeon]